MSTECKSTRGSSTDLQLANLQARRKGEEYGGVVRVLTRHTRAC